jgi:integron integrase
MNEAEILRHHADLCRLKHLAVATEKSYAGWIQSYIKALKAMPKEWTSERKVEAFLTGLAHREVAASTQNQALNALAFLYREGLGKPLGTVDALRVRRPASVRTALSEAEVRSLLGTMEDVGGYPTRLVARLLYGCGLRVSEPLELRVKDVDLAGGRLVIRAAKGNKDRIVPLPEALRGEIEAQLRVARATARGDAAAGLPVAMPTALARKYPKAALQEAWAWLFPAHQPTAHPRTRETVRWRMHEVNVQRAVRAAAEKAGLAVRVTPHVLRHCYATHVHRAGAAARDVQEVLGHTKLETTMRYLAAEPAKVRSPLDAA